MSDWMTTRWPAWVCGIAQIIMAPCAAGLRCGRLRLVWLQPCWTQCACAASLLNDEPTHERNLYDPGSYSLSPSHHDRLGSGRRQRDRHRPRRRRAAEGAAQQGDPDRHPRCNRSAHRICGAYDATTPNRGPSFSRWDPTALGMLEDVARVAHGPSRGG